VARVAGFPKACGLRPSRTLSPSKPLQRICPWLFLPTLTRPCPKQPPKRPIRPAPGLLLTGGGARAAYQVGVLEAIADLRQACGAGGEPNPFPIITGTSAGAINAAALACGADHFDRAVRRIARVWRQFHATRCMAPTR
jgi:NTE family protein